ncbi:MAG: DNA repair protein RecN [Ferruginibacter sp.]
MLQKLHIQNYAIIENLTIKFCDRLNIITGETGAGKSILMGALNLILGERADSSVLLNKEKKSVVEGWFRIEKNNNISEFFKENDLDIDDVIMLRREISSNGKSRGFINDTPVNLSQLKTLGVLLVDLHQQFDTQELGSENFQRAVLDALADNASLLLQIRQQFNAYALAKKELEKLKLQQASATKEQDYNQFLFDELKDINLKENETELLETELKLLNSSESVKQQLGSVYASFYEHEQPIVQQLKVILNTVTNLKEYHPDLAILQERLNSSVIELSDIADEIGNMNDNLQYDAERIELINDRLSLAYKLMKKHGVQTTRTLLSIMQELNHKLASITNLSAAIDEKNNITENLLKVSQQIAIQISTRRISVVKSFEQQVKKLLHQVGMPNALLKIQIVDSALNETGADEIVFLFDANKSGRFEKLSKVASGGELSRLMLCIKSLVAKKLQLPTLIFDEIDSGISGEAAKQVGIIMKDLSYAHQMIAITHQPQIAARADEHLFVYKDIVTDKIVTSIKILNNDERITAIAKMMSGEKPTAAALENAREMIGN